MERYEKAFLTACAAVLVIFLCALGYGSVGMGVHLPSHSGMIYCDVGQKLRKVLRATPPFDHIGVQQIAPGKYQAVVIAQTWSFTPDEIDVPVDADVSFVATSSDVIHGFFIPGTRVNMMLIPGQVSEFDYRFTKPGEYLLICQEYCGRLHHTMSGKVVVK
ncbi:MAG TPA: cytochrome c oxidase subunit II [Candidatus Binatus sp.]|uniref:cytochrome c oxidase subunit II n=1 Tax=Candidatus Binatus sp. TaxID=2811406 RepID=UPI002B4A43D9|nr:cytochrome c oxidase subunit II [Candidatus Binatus sp.]HKN15068.1 cytochrome c oxidase subunit II [Candidatus Binatus sp.]